MSELTRSISPGNRSWAELDTLAGHCSFKEAKSEFFQYTVDITEHYIKEQKRQKKQQKRQERLIILLGVLLVSSIVLQVLQLVWNT